MQSTLDQTVEPRNARVQREEICSPSHVVEEQHSAFRLVGQQRHGSIQIVVEHQGGKPLRQCSVAVGAGSYPTVLLEQLSDVVCLPQLESACEMFDVVAIGGLGCWLLEQQWGHDGCCFERDARRTLCTSLLWLG